MNVILTFLLIFTCVRDVTAPYGPLPDEPFHFIYQYSSFICQDKFNMTFENVLKDSGILFNEADTFWGPYSVILYRKLYGYWPHYLHGNDPPFHGGIPQLGNLTKHLEGVERAIEDAIPNKDFHGVAVINMEQFRPLWKRNWGSKDRYRQESVKLARSQLADQIPTNPSNKEMQEWDKIILNEAVTQFEYHAKEFMSESLRLSRKLRPDGLWGYYNFPYCFNRNPMVIHCRPLVVERNNQIKWLWEESTGIFPSIYVYEWQLSDLDLVKFMYGNIEEGLRVGDMVGGRPVYVYAKTNWNGTIPILPYREITMLNTLRLPAEFGVDGTILWTSSADFNKQMDCERSAQVLREVIIPYARNVLTFTKVCSNLRCSGRGRCVHRGAIDDKYADEILRTTVEQLMDFTIDARYSCRCYKGYSNKDCSSSVSAGHVITISMFLILIIALNHLVSFI